MDLEIRKFLQTIEDLINKSTLPMEVIRLALKDILSRVEFPAINEINEQLKKLNDKTQKTDKKNTNGFETEKCDTGIEETENNEV